MTTLVRSSGTQLCLTGGERNVDALARRLARGWPAPRTDRGFPLTANSAHGAPAGHPGEKEPPPRHEVRLDCLERLDGQVFALLEKHRDVIVTCRSQAEGGEWKGTAAEQAEVLRQAIASGVGYVDTEISLPPMLRRELYRNRGHTRIILSLHHLDRGAWPDARIGAMTKEPGDVLKLALRCEDAADLVPLAGLLRSDPRPAVRIGLGDEGMLSRLLPQAFDAPWTYILAGGAPPVAPGQIDESTAKKWGVGRPGLTPLALLGGPQVLTSPGPTIYNSLFSRRQLPFQYLPVVTRRPREVLTLFRRLGFGGCSVTMPAKVDLLPHVEVLSEEASTAGALNTIRFDAGRAVATNTDVIALRTLLGPIRDHPALILGAGGFAAAAAAVLRGQVSIASRTEAPGRRLADRFGHQWVPWAHRERVRAALVVNATPIGSNGVETPLPEDYVTEEDLRWVVDAVVASSGEETPLCHSARAAGAHTVDGLRVWAEQGAVQISALVGERVDSAELDELLIEHGWCVA